MTISIKFNLQRSRTVEQTKKIGVQELQEFRSQELPESARPSPFSATPELLQLLNSYSLLLS
jgi:hypothetical protein